MGPKEIKARATTALDVRQVVDAPVATGTLLLATTFPGLWRFAAGRVGRSGLGVTGAEQGVGLGRRPVGHVGPVERGSAPNRAKFAQVPEFGPRCRPELGRAPSATAAPPAGC